MKKLKSIFEDQESLDWLLNQKKPEDIWEAMPYRTYVVNGKKIRKHAPVKYEERTRHIDGRKIETKETPFELKKTANIKEYAKQYSKGELKSIFTGLRKRRKK